MYTYSYLTIHNKMIILSCFIVVIMKIIKYFNYYIFRQNIKYQVFTFLKEGIKSRKISH